MSIIAVLDADVLVPILSCDVLLSMFDADLYQPIVTPTILAEVERNLIESHPNHDVGLLRRRVGYMTTALGTHIHADAAFTGFAEINTKDRHVVAAAMAGKATHIVTNDRRLRREITRLGTPVQALTNDQFATFMVQQSPRQVSEGSRSGEAIEDLSMIRDHTVDKRVELGVGRTLIKPGIGQPGGHDFLRNHRRGHAALLGKHRQPRNGPLGKLNHHGHTFQVYNPPGQAGQEIPDPETAATAGAMRPHSHRAYLGIGEHSAVRPAAQSTPWKLRNTPSVP